MFNARPDALGIALTGGALLAATSWEETRGRRALWLAAAACVAILFTRTNFAPILLAIGIGFFLRDKGAALRFAAYTAGGSFALFVLTDVLTDGAFVRNQVDFYSMRNWWPGLLGAVDAITLPFPNPILAIGAAAVAIALGGWRTAPSAVWAWLASILILLTAVRVGAAENYAFPLAFTSSILLGPALARVRRSVSEGAAGAVAFAIALLLLPSAILAVRQLPSKVDHLGELEAVNQAAVRQLEGAQGPLLGDRLDLLLAAGGGLYIYDFVNTELAFSGVWDEEPLAARIEAQDFALIQVAADPTKTGVWTPRLTEALRTAYCPVFGEEVVFPGQSIWILRPCDGAAKNSQKGPVQKKKAAQEQ